MTGPSPARQLAEFLARYDPAIAACARSALTRLRRRLPGATELVYDNYNGLAIGFGPTERGSDAIVSLVLYPRWVTLFFLEGARLRDPQKLLRGSGNQVRHIVLEDPDDIDSAGVANLIERALELAGRPFDGRCKRRLIIKSISKRQRSRRPVTTKKGG